jgi:CRISPR-associated exonuclease Cas4
VELSNEDILSIENTLKDLEIIVKSNEPPELEKKRICKSCAYHDLCFI